MFPSHDRGVQIDLEIASTGGTVTFAGTNSVFNFGGGMTFTYTSGTLDFSTNSIIPEVYGTATIDSDGMTWPEFIFSERSDANVTLSSNMTISGIMNIGDRDTQVSTITINGAFKIFSTGGVRKWNGEGVTGAATVEFSGSSNMN